jgi:acyl carrier protein
VEEEILSIWQESLGVEKIGVQDDFLALGGDSIQAARILFRVNERFSMDLQISDIFTTSTVASMANLVQEKKSGCRT